MIWPRLFLLASRAANYGLLEVSHRLRRSAAWGMPAHIMMEPTNACNARCPLCPTGMGSMNRPAAMMKLETFQRVIDEVYPYVHSLSLWNLGEPFLNRQAFDMIRYAQAHHISVKVSTNGFVLYNKDRLQDLIDSELDYLIVSLDGATQAVFNQYRVGVDFDKVMSGLQTLQALKDRLGVLHPILEWQFIVMKHNENEIEAARALARQLGMNFSLKTAGVPASNPELYDRYLPQNKGLSRYVQKQDGGYAINSKPRNDCPWPWHSLVINADGQMVACCYDYYSQLQAGSVQANSVRTIWNSAFYRNLRQGILKDRGTMEPCAMCAVDSRSALFLESHRSPRYRLRSWLAERRQARRARAGEIA